MFQPQYTITEALLHNVKRIEGLTEKLRCQRLPSVVLRRFEREARAISSFASTSIEGNPLSLTDVKRLLKSHPKRIRDSEREVLNYNRALERIAKQARSGCLTISHTEMTALQRQVTEELLPTSDCGQYRTQPVFVNDPKTRKTIYWPPDAHDVHPLMGNLIKWVRAEQRGADPLIVAGIFHRQFVLIHPFLDGNGRTARLLTTMLLAHGGFDLFRLFSFERYYNDNVARYFEKVGARGNYYDIAESIDFTEWLEYFTDGIIDELLRVQKQIERMHVADIRLKPHHQKILRHLQKHGSIMDVEYAKLTRRAKATRVLDFKDLISFKLIERKGKGRATYYVLEEG